MTDALALAPSRTGMSRQEWAEVEFWCGRVREIRWVHYSRLDPRPAAEGGAA